MNAQEREESMNLKGLHGLSNENLAFTKLLHKDEPIIVKDGVTKEQVEQLGKDLDQLSDKENGQDEKEVDSAQTKQTPVTSPTKTNTDQDDTPAA
jgi:hypothetical protein